MAVPQYPLLAYGHVLHVSDISSSSQNVKLSPQQAVEAYRVVRC
jgi:hypothetical protein